MGALGRTARHLKAGFATLLLLTFATTFAPLAALAQTSVSLSIADATGAESAGPLSFTVTATPTPTSPVTFKYTVTKETGDTATAGVEFIAVTTATTASIAANASTTTITVSVVDDNILGSDRTFTVTLSEPSAGVTISDAVATGTITEDDEGSVTVSTAALTVAEGGSGNYTVKLDVQPTANVTVTVAGASGDVTVMGSPLTFTSINFSTAQTVTVNAGEDLDTATDPDVTLTHSASGGGYGSVSIASVVVSVTENDTPPSVGTAPAAPTGLTVTPGNRLVVLSWSDPNNAGITGWQYRQKAGGGAWGAWTDIGSSGATTTSHTVSGLNNGTAYVFQVRARKGNVNGASSGDSSSVTPRRPEPTGNDGDGGDSPEKSVMMTRASLRVAESAGNATLTVTASPALGESVTFNVTYAGTATGANNPANGDYDNDAVTSVTFGPTDTSKNIVIPITDDSVDDDDETIIVSIALAPGNTLPEGFSITRASTTVTITDNDSPSVSVPSTLSVAENAGNAVVTITTTRAFGQSMTFDITYGDGTATGANNPANGDYDNDAVTQVTFNATDTTKDITIPITDDAVAEDDETFTVTIAPGQLSEEYERGNFRTTVTITDDDASPALSIAAPAAVTEGDSGSTDMTFTVSLDAASSRSVTVDYAVAASSTATTNTDFTGGSGTLTFAAGDTSKTITVSVTGDELDEEDETVVIQLSNAGNASIGTATATGTITDDDASPALSIAAPAAVTEGDSGSTDMIFTVSLDAASSRSVTVDYAVAASSTATTNTDFTGGSGTLTFAAGDTSKTITVSVTGDELDEEDETVVIEWSNAGNASIGTATATGTITDDDASPTLSIAAPAAVTEGDSGSTDMTFTVSLDAASSRSVTVDYAVDDDTSTAVAGTDFTDLSGTLTFAAGDTSKTITVSVTGDELDEEDETVVIEWSNAGNATLGTATATGTITDDDASPQLAPLNAVTVKLGEAADLTATATDEDGDTVSYAWTRDAGETTPALPGGTGLNQARLTFTPPAIGVYTMTVTAADGNGNTDSGEVTITVGTADTLSLPSTLSVTEGTDSSATIAVTASAALGGSGLTLNVTYNGGNSDTATGANNPANGDYDNDAVTQVVFGASETTKNIVIPITDDDLDEPAETFTVTIALADGSTLPDGFVLGNATTTVTITDDDESPAMTEAPTVDNDDNPGVTLAPTALEIAEGGSGSYTLVLDTQPSGEVTVTVGGATDEVTAQPASLSFTLANWSDPQSVTVESAHDDDALPDEAVRLTHSASGGGYNGVTIDPVTVTVVEDDEAAVTLSETELVIDEGAQGRYTVVLETQPVGGEVTVTPISAEPMALAVSGALRFGASNWNIAQTVTVTGVRDTDTQDATVRVSHTVSGGDYEGVTAASVTVTVTDQTLAGRHERANRINAEVLPQIAVATMSHTLSAVTERMEEAASCEARVGSLRLGARPSAPLEDEWGVQSSVEPASPSVSELLDGSSFTLPVGASGTDMASSTLSVWGRGERGSLSGTERAVSWDGELWTAHLGADWCQRSDLVAGAALAYSESDLDAGVGDGVQVVHETKMTSLHPYAVWRLADGSNLWGSVGYGSGEARISESEDGIHSPTLTQDLSQWSVAMGGRRVLLEEESAVGVDRVALKGEGALARLDTAANDGLSSLAVKTTRLRLLLEASHERTLEGDATMTPSLEVGLRRDGGDLGSGLGLEAGASLLWRAPQTGWTGELRARALVAHERDRDEWGISARLRLDPASDGRGLSLSFGPEYGYTETEIEGLFDYDPVPVATDSAVEEDMEGRVQAEMGYGIGISRSGPMALLTPYAGFTLGRSGEETFRVGARYRLGEGLSLGIEGKHQAQAVGESSLMLRAVVRW